MNLHKMYHKTVSSIISQIFDKICFAPLTTWLVFTSLTSTIANKNKIRVNISLKTTFMPNFIKIDDTDFGMFPC